MAVAEPLPARLQDTPPLGRRRPSTVGATHLGCPAATLRLRDKEPSEILSCAEIYVRTQSTEKRLARSSAFRALVSRSHRTPCMVHCGGSGGIAAAQGAGL